MSTFKRILMLAGVLALVLGLAGRAVTADKKEKKIKKKASTLLKSPKKAERIEGAKLLLQVTDASYAMKKALGVIAAETEFNSDVTEAAFEVVEKHITPKFNSLILKHAKKASTVAAKIGFVKILWKMDDPKAFDLLLKYLVQGKSEVGQGLFWPVRMRVSEYMAASNKAKGVEQAKRAVEALLKQLAREVDGRTKKYLRAALWHLIGRDYKDDIKKWKKYWEEIKDTYDGPPQDKKKDKKEKDEGPYTADADGKIDLSTALIEEEEEVEDDPAAKKPTFFGQELGKKRVAFVIDVSGSMQGGKLASLKSEMSRTINAMDATYKFNMYFYNAGVSAWKTALVKATPEIRKEAVTFVNSKMASGMTNIDAALRMAANDADVQTLFLLSDGCPTVGVTDTGMLLAGVRAWNKYKKIIINTVGMAGCDVNFMQKLASQNGGKYSTAH